MATSGQQIEGVKCPHCGTENEARETHCFNCGKPLVVIQDDPKKKPTNWAWVVIIFLIFILLFLDYIGTPSPFSIF